MPGGIQMAWGAPAVRAHVADQRGEPADLAQLALPLFGVLPGGTWRAHSAPATKVQRLPAHLLELRRCNRADVAVQAEIRARTITVATAKKWKGGVELPTWFVAMIPRRLQRLTALVFEVYQRGAFGMRDTQEMIGASLNYTGRSIGTHVRDARELGLISTVQLWHERADGKTRWVCLYRPGPVLEMLAGLVAFQRQKTPPDLVMLAGFPGEARQVRITKAVVRERALLLRQAAARWLDQSFAARSNGGRMEQPSPERFCELMAEVLEEREAKRKKREKTKPMRKTGAKALPPDFEFAGLDEIADLGDNLEPEPFDCAEIMAKSSALAPPEAAEGASPRTSAPVGDRPSDATGGASEPARASASPTKNGKTFLSSTPLPKRVGATSKTPSAPVFKKEFPPVASEGRSPTGADVRGDAPSAEILKRWRDGDLTAEQRTALARVERVRQRADKPPRTKTRAGAAPEGARGGPSEFAALLPTGYWLPDEGEDG